jgi:hypothetical protein
MADLLFRRRGSQGTLDSLPLKTRENLGTLDRRILELSDWIERDRNEPDKVVAYAHDLRAAVLRAEAIRHA